MTEIWYALSAPFFAGFYFQILRKAKADVFGKKTIHLTIYCLLFFAVVYALSVLHIFEIPAMLFPNVAYFFFLVFSMCLVILHKDKLLEKISEGRALAVALLFVYVLSAAAFTSSLPEIKNIFEWGSASISNSASFLIFGVIPVILVFILSFSKIRPNLVIKLLIYFWYLLANLLFIYLIFPVTVTSIQSLFGGFVAGIVLASILAKLVELVILLPKKHEHNYLGRVESEFAGSESKYVDSDFPVHKSVPVFLLLAVFFIINFYIKFLDMQTVIIIGLIISDFLHVERPSGEPAFLEGVQE